MLASVHTFERCDPGGLGDRDLHRRASESELQDPHCFTDLSLAEQTECFFDHVSHGRIVEGQEGEGF